MARRIASSISHRKITSMTAERRGGVNCEITPRGGWTNTRHKKATMTIADDDGSNRSPNRMIVAYSAATATTAGKTAWTPARIATMNVCLAKTGWVISVPLFYSRTPAAEDSAPAHDIIIHDYLPFATSAA